MCKKYNQKGPVISPTFNQTSPPFPGKQDSEHFQLFAIMSSFFPWEPQTINGTNKLHTLNNKKTVPLFNVPVVVQFSSGHAYNMKQQDMP